MGAAAVKPHVENVSDAFIIIKRVSIAKQALGRIVAPAVHALVAHRRDDPRVDGGVIQILAGFAIDEQRDRHAPRALTAEHPIRAAFHHAIDPVAALFGDKARGSDGAEGAGA